MMPNCSKQDVFFDEHFVPAFFNMSALGDLLENATAICGDNKACLYDIAQTRNLALGKSTQMFEEEAKKEEEELGR